MIELLTATLAPFGYPVIRQGSLTEDEAYPEHFFTFFNTSTESDNYYDNVEDAYVWEYELNLYSVDPEVVNYTLRDAVKLLKSQGFIVSGVGHDVASDESTHEGRGVTIQYIERGVN